MSELAEEQEHLDRTYAAYDALLDALSVSRRDRHGDDFTEEALEQMRRERLRVVHRARAGRCTSGASTGRTASRCTSAATRSPTRDNELLSINWRAPAAEPFYAATPHDPHGLTRRRRLDIEDREVLGFVDEHARGGRRATT